MSQYGRKTAGMTLIVTLVVFASKGVGFIRDIMSAAYFGTSAQYDAYVSAYGLFYVPVLLLSSCVTSTIIPMLVDARYNDGIEKADRFASNAVNLSAIAGSVIGIIMMLLAEPIVQLVYPGFDAEKRQLTARLLNMMLPCMLFMGVSLTLTSILNASEHFIAAQLTGFPLSFSIMAGTVFFSEKYGIVPVAIATSVAGVLEAVILLPAAKKSFKYSLHIDFHDTRLKKLMRLALPAMLSMAVNELNHLIDRSLASGLNTGDISTMNYAYRLITFALGLLTVPVNTIMFRQMSECASKKDYKGVVSITMDCIEAISMLVLPVIVIGCVLSKDIIEMLYQRGRFDEASTIATSGVFCMYLVGLLGFALRDMMNRSFHSVMDTKTPMRLAFVTVALNIILNLILSKFMGVNGLAIATSISCATGALLLLWRLHVRFGDLRLANTGKELLKIAVGAAVACVVAMLLNKCMPWHGVFPLLGKLILTTGVSLIAYGAVILVLKVRQVRLVTRFLHRG